MRKGILGAALAAIVAAPTVARADDFVGLAAYTFEDCEQYAWDNYPVNDERGVAEYCMTALITMGRHAETGTRGVMIDFIRSSEADLPGTMQVHSRLAAVYIDGMLENVRHYPYFLIGGSAMAGSNIPTPSIHYNAFLTADSRPFSVQAHTMAVNIPGFEPAGGGDERHPHFTLTRVQVLPEPGTYALMATGLVGIAGVGWRRRRS